MIAVAYYLLKVFICSGILYGYYRLALHNKLFHRWNRFYLLTAIVISLSFPLIKINIMRNPSQDTNEVIKLLNVVTTGDEIIIEANAGGKPLISGEEMIICLYILVSLGLLFMLMHTLYNLSRLIKKNASQFIYGIRLVNTDAKGTPFSFFRNIFWNSKIDIDSATGERIFRHELAHVQEKHSADKLFINIVLIFFWCNPFFWLIRREMNMIHEFIADSKAVEDNDTGALAAMIIQATYPQHSFGLTSSFFSSSIKRRILMLTKMQNPNVHYISRVLVLPLLVFVFVAFTFKTKHLKSTADTTTNIAFSKSITVVIDAGHGGNEPGARALDGAWEKDITLAIAKKVQELNTNAGIKILLTRETDVFQPIKEKVEWTVKQKPDAFISIHVGATQDTIRSGFDIYISRKENQTGNKTKLLASSVIQEVKNTYTISNETLQRTGRGIWVLDAPEIDYPAILIECGYLTNKKDLAFISNTANQEKIARNILAAIAKYASAKDEYATTEAAPQSSFFTESNNAGEAFKAENADTIPQKTSKVVEVSPENKVFQKVEIEATFPGGDSAWLKYISGQVNKYIDTLQEAKVTGTCLVQFIVDKEGKVSDVQALTLKGTKFSEVIVEAIATGPAWNPAMQKGNKVKSYRKQPVTFQIAEE